MGHGNKKPRKSASDRIGVSGRTKNRRRKIKREERRDGCSGKKRYDYVDAVLAAQTLIRFSGNPAMGVYLCMKCCQYHVTRSLKPRKGQMSVRVTLETSAQPTQLSQC